MSEEREAQAGAPVEQQPPSENEVLEAVERASEPVSEASPIVPAEPVVAPASDAAGPEVVTPAMVSEQQHSRPEIVAVEEPPSAGQGESAEQIFAAHTPKTEPATVAQTTVAPAVVEPEARPGGSSQSSELAAALDSPAVSPERDGEIRISADHPMAALYMQTPTPPETRGNRFAGIMIALLSTVAFAIVYAGVLALWQAPHFPPSTFLDQGLLPHVLSWEFAVACAAFFVGLSLLVVIVGKAGWWAYVLGGFFVAAFVWAAAVFGTALVAHLDGASVSLDPWSLVTEYGLFFPVLAAALVAREVSVWFGAWIGSRGRKVKRANAQAIAEYEEALSDSQATPA